MAAMEVMGGRVWPTLGPRVGQPHRLPAVSTAGQTPTASPGGSRSLAWGREHAFLWVSQIQRQELEKAEPNALHPFCESQVAGGSRGDGGGAPPRAGEARQLLPT